MANSNCSASDNFVKSSFLCTTSATEDRPDFANFADFGLDGDELVDAATAADCS